MTVISGKLRHRVTIQQPTTVDGSAGGSYETWSNVATVWAQVTPSSGREFWEIRKSNSEIDGEVRMRYRGNINPTMRLLFKNRPLEIQHIINRDEKNELLKVYYKEAQT